MAGHSKWANIKHRKGRQDALKSSLTQKISNKIQQAAASNPDPKTNSILKNLIAEARAANLSKHVWENAISKSGKTVASETFLFELRFGETIDLIVKVAASNFANINSMIKKQLKKSNIKFLPSNSIQFLFQKKFIFHLPILTEEQTLSMLEFEIDNFSENDNKTLVMIVDSETAKQFGNWCNEQEIEIENQEETLLPISTVSPSLELLSEYNKLKEIIFAIPECQQIFDNVKPVK